MTKPNEITNVDPGAFQMYAPTLYHVESGTPLPVNWAGIVQRGHSLWETCFSVETGTRQWKYLGERT